MWRKLERLERHASRMRALPEAVTLSHERASALAAWRRPRGDSAAGRMHDRDGWEARHCRYVSETGNRCSIPCGVCDQLRRVQDA